MGLDPPGSTTQRCYSNASCEGESFPVGNARECCAGTDEEPPIQMMVLDAPSPNVLVSDVLLY